MRSRPLLIGLLAAAALALSAAAPGGRAAAGSAGPLVTITHLDIPAHPDACTPSAGAGGAGGAGPAVGLPRVAAPAGGTGGPQAAAPAAAPAPPVAVNTPVTNAAATALPDAGRDAGRYPPPRITAHAVVTESTGVPIADLKQDSFEVTEDGRPVKNLCMTDSTSGADPISVALALDTSGSMAEALPQLQEAARTFVGTLAPGDQVAVFGFGSQPSGPVAFSADHDAAIAAINGLYVTPFADTPLYDAAFAAVSAAASRPSGRRVAVVMTDGEDTISAIKPDDVITRALDRNVPVFTIGLGKVQRDYLARLASTTGGDFLDVPSPDQLTASFKSLAESLRREYLLTFDGEPRNQAGERVYQVAVNLRGQTATAVIRGTIPASVPESVTPAFLTPAENQRVSRDVRIEANVEPQVSAKQVRFLVDGREIDTKTAPPFETVWHAGNVITGRHLLRIEATGLDDRTFAVERSVMLTDSNSNASLMLGGLGFLAVLALLTGAILVGRHRRAEHEAAPAGGPVTAGVARRDDGGAGASMPVPSWPAPAGGAVTAGAAVPPAGVAVMDAPAGWFTEVRPDGSTWEWPLTHGETLIGREVSNPHILLDDIDVSRRHAAVRAEGGRLVYHDLGPTNASVINGAGYQGPHALADGDEVIVGTTRLRFHGNGFAR